MSISAIFKQVLNEITPGKEEQEMVTGVNNFIKELRQQLKKKRISAKVVLGGSFAKDTWLKGDHDVDIFVAFAKKYINDSLSNILEGALRKWKTVRIHGSRDYFQVRNGANFEIVPVLQIKGRKDAQNVTDFSIEHVSWVNKNAKSLKNDIRLMKKFCKANNVYGAESYIRGFSGHVVDLLIIHYGGFLKLLKASQKWKPKTIIDTMNAHKGSALFHLNKSKTQGPLIIVDPVQSDRNAAASLTQEKYDLFISAAAKFLARPSESHFMEKKVDTEAIRKKGALILRARTLKAKEDVAGTKMVKAFDFLQRRLGENGFTVSDSGWSWDKKSKAVFWFRTKEKKLSPKMKKIGPPAKMKDAAVMFRRKYKKVRTAKGVLFATVKRKLRTPEAVLKISVGDYYLKDKLRGINLD